MIYFLGQSVHDTIQDAHRRESAHATTIYRATTSKVHPCQASVDPNRFPIMLFVPCRGLRSRFLGIVQEEGAGRKVDLRQPSSFLLAS
jgi:hypothetical protein